MKLHPSWIRAAGLAAVSAVLFMAAACGEKERTRQGSAGASPANTAPAATAPASPAASPKKSWPQPPAMQINPDKSYTAEVKTTKGSFTIELFAKDAPKAVNNFVFLSKEKFYDGIVFHRIIETFMIQTGDPNGNGTGGPGYKFEHEPTEYTFDKGIVAMANSGLDTNGSQFFIVTGNASHLNNKPYTVFGKIKDGMDTVTEIAKTPVKVNPLNGSKETPTEKVAIESITIVEK